MGRESVHRSNAQSIAFVLALSTCVVPVAVEAQQARARLWYAVEAGVTGCPDAGGFQDRVAARIGYVPFDREAQLEFDVRISVQAQALVGVVTLRGQGEAGGERRFDAGLGECEALAEAMALAIALRIDPVAAEAGGPPSPATPTAPPPAATGAAPAAPQAAPTGIRVRLESNEADVTFHRQVGMSTGIGYAGGYMVAMMAQQYEPLCTAPCEVDLPAGTHRLALSYRGGPPLMARDAVVVDRPSVLEGTYTSRARRRRAGWITLGVGSAVGMAVMLSSLAFIGDIVTGEGEDWTAMGALLGVGGGILLVSEIVGLVLAMAPDRAAIRALPLGISM